MWISWFVLEYQSVLQHLWWQVVVAPTGVCVCVEKSATTAWNTDVRTKHETYPECVWLADGADRFRCCCCIRKSNLDGCSRENASDEYIQAHGRHPHHQHTAHSTRSVVGGRWCITAVSPLLCSCNTRQMAVAAAALHSAERLSVAECFCSDVDESTHTYIHKHGAHSGWFRWSRVVAARCACVWIFPSDGRLGCLPSECWWQTKMDLPFQFAYAIGNERLDELCDS